MNLTSLIGTMDNTIVEYMDETNTFIIGSRVVYDIEYIVKAIVLFICLTYFFKGVLALIRLGQGLINSD